MEPLLALWWIVPAAAAGGGATWAAIRFRRRSARPTMSRGAARRLELDAALFDLKQAQDASVRGRAEVQAAQADVMRVQAEQTRSRTDVPAAAIAGAKRRLQIARREVQASAADIRARRAAVKVARATMPTWGSARDQEPLVKLMAVHDAVLARWMAYETDPGLAIAYPSMSDPQTPALAAFLRQQRLTAQLRPSAPDARTTPTAYSAYRDAVRLLAHTLDAAELDARRRAGERVPEETIGETFAGFAQDLADGAQRAFWTSMDAIRDRSRRPRP
jgi:hypothetical protein